MFLYFFFFFKQKTAYEITTGDWSSDVCSSDLWTRPGLLGEIETAGFTIVEVDGLVGPLAWTTQIRLLAYSQAARRLPVIGGALAAALALGMNTRMVLEDRITPASVRQDHACVYLVLARPAGSP